MKEQRVRVRIVASSRLKGKEGYLVPGSRALVKLDGEPVPMYFFRHEYDIVKDLDSKG